MKIPQLFAFAGNEWLANKNNREFRAVHDEEVLRYFGQAIVFTLIPLLFIIFAIAAILYNQFADTTYYYVWVSAAVLCQIPRLILAFKVKNTNLPKAHRMRYARVIALLLGLSLGGLAFLAPDMNTESRALISMILVAVTTTSVATCLGYKPLYFIATTPVYCATICLWLFDPNNNIPGWEQIVVMLLVLQFFAVMFKLATQVHIAFVSNLLTQSKLEAALAAEQQANAAKTRFLAAASHDLRQPLHAMSFLSAALTLRDLDEESKTIATKLNEAMKLLSGELDALLDISKLDANIVPVNPATINLSEFTRQMAEASKPVALEKNLSFSLQLQPDVHVKTDEELFGRTLRNIIENAIRYTECGGISIELTGDRDRTLLAISDTGIGIPLAEQKNIWEEFYQVSNKSRNRQQGLGLGLSVVKRLANLLDINVSLQRSDNTGSTFHIELDSVACENVTTGESDPASDQVRTILRAKHVLIVDDDESVLVSTQTLLHGLGMKTSVAEESEGAIKALSATKIDCILMDLGLTEDEDGFEAIDKIRLAGFHTPVLILSGATTPDRIKQATDSGYGWLVKPASVEQLVSEMTGILQ